MAFDKKAYMRAYSKRLDQREKQRKREKAYRDRVKSTPEGLAQWAKKAREYRASEGGRRKARNRVLRYHYGITVDDYDCMAAAQGYSCAICGAEPWMAQYGVLHVDHDHATGAVRELLCSACNLALGALQDSPQLAEKAAAYLRQHGRL